MSELNLQTIVTEKEVKRYINSNIWNDIKDYFFYFLKVTILICTIYIFVRSSVAESVSINGQSMFPNYNAQPDSADKILIDKLTPKFGTYKRGEVIVLISPDECAGAKKSLFLKRIIGLPGESVKFKNGDVYIVNKRFPKGIKIDESDYLESNVKTYKNLRINQLEKNSSITELRLEENEYYVIGDNRAGSRDSRVCGPISKSNIIGREIYRMTPSQKAGFFTAPEYKIGSQN